VRRIDAAAQPERGYWERRGWTPTAPVRTMCRIDVPVPGQHLPTRDLLAGGVAFAGDRGISRVEVSLDQGEAWAPARLETAPPADACLVWRRWAAQLRFPGEGRFQVLARAVDGTGGVQDAALRRSFPAGASGYHRVLVVVDG
jgi:hypothetical protein